MWNRTKTIVAMLAAVVAVCVGGVTADRSVALTGSDFDPGYIISDERFFDHTSMTQAQIQQFLDKMVPVCRSTDPTLPCLKNLVTSTNTRSAQPVGHCTAYQSEGWESAARILWRVAQACRINPQVLIVMLQKEQSLITATQPTAWQYRAAMGADCPDTAPCAPTTVGFFNQVYKAAWQLRQYTYNPSGWRHRIGMTEVYWSPNSSCGTSLVNIRNQATVNLYNFTPYRPNAASLANLYGTGDACSTYGNRNFWRFFNEWFGTSTANGVTAITALHTSMGGDTGALGTATSLVHSISEGGGGTAQAFQYGSAYWTTRTGAQAVLDPERALYFGYGGSLGVLGWPSSGRIAGSENGYGQAFTTGAIYSSAGVIHAVHGPMLQPYFARGGASGWLGYPAGEPTSLTGGSAQDYARGSLFVQTNGWGGAVGLSLLGAYRDLGGPLGELGWPRSDTVALAGNGGGSAQAFERSSLYGSSVGTFAVSGAIRDYYFTRGGAAGTLGWPISSEICVSPTQCQQDFQTGTIFWVSGQGTRVGSSAIESYLASSASIAAALGAKTSEAIWMPQNGGGFGQTFVGGSVYAGTPGVYRVQGSARNLYWSLGGSIGSLGWPTSEWRSTSSTQGSQSFQNGTVYVEDVGGAYVGLPAIESVWWAAGGPGGTIGPRLSSLLTIVENGGGFGQVFRNASIYSSPAGAFAVAGVIRDAYFGRGGAAGPLGWPTRAEACTATGCEQRFQGGTITSSAGSVGVVTTP